MKDWLQDTRLQRFAVSLMELIERAGTDTSARVFVRPNLTTLHEGYANVQTTFTVEVDDKTYAITIEELTR